MHATCFFMASNLILFCFVLLFTANLINVHEKIHSRPATWMVAAFLPVPGVESTWDERGGNSNAVRNTELMMECNDCLFEGDWCRKAETRRLYELDPSLPRLYVMPISSILGKLPLVRAGDTGTIQHSMRGRAEQCFPGGKADTSPGKGDGSRLYFVNSWAMKWSQHP